MKKKFAEYGITFVCRGITSLLARKQKLQEFLQFMQLCAANPEMTQIMAQTWPPDKIFAYLAMLMDVDVAQLKGSPRDQQMLQMQNQQKQQQGLQQEGAAESAKAGAKEDARANAEIKIMSAQHMFDHRVEQRQKAALMKNQPVPAVEAAKAQGAGNGGQGQG